MLTPTGVFRFRLANTEFVSSFPAGPSTPSFFPVEMPAEAIEGFPSLCDVLRFKRVLQVAGRDLGSVALTALVGAPAQMVAVVNTDVAPESLVEFSRYRGIEDRLRVHRAEPADSDQLTRLVAEEFGPDGLEVVIDHLSEDRDTGVRLFETLFPLIVPGGSYVIERWSWEHFVLESMLAGADATDGPTIEEQRAEAVQRVRATKGEVLEAILPDLVEAASSRPEFVAGVTTSRYWLEVRRGPATAEASTFRLARTHPSDARTSVRR